MDDTDKVDGYKIDLSDGRHVFVAEQETRTLVQFKNAEGALTHLALSRDAARALRDLLSLNSTAEDRVMKLILSWAQVEGTKETEMVWQEAKPDTAPVVR